MTTGGSRERGAQALLVIVLVMLSTWIVAFLVAGPELAVNHDELNFIVESLRLAAEHRLQDYGHGPLLHELIAAAEVGIYASLRVLGRVLVAEDFLAHVLRNLHAHLVLARAVAGAAAVLMLVQVYRLGSLFGGRWAGALAATLCGTNLTFVALSSMAKEDTLFWLLLVTACHQAWVATERGRRIACVLAGAVIGAATVAKLFGIFATVLVTLPLLNRRGRPWAARWRLSVWMALGAGATTLLLHPFLLTDTERVVATVHGMAARTEAWPGLVGLALPVYLGVHLPNTVGWPVYILGTGELIRRLFRDPLGPVLLSAVPLLILAFLSSRHGHTMAHYAFPVSLLLCILAASLVLRVFARLGPRAGYAALAAVGLVAVLDGAFLPGSLKHAGILLGQDVRLLARDLLETRARPGECILITDALVGANFWGPPLLPLEEPRGEGPYARAWRRVLRETEGPRFRLRLVDAHPGFADQLVDGCDWIVTPRFGWPTVELGPAPVRQPPPPEFERVATLEATPAERSYPFPHYTSLDYWEIGKLPLRTALLRGVFGWTLEIYRRRPA